LPLCGYAASASHQKIRYRAEHSGLLLTTECIVAELPEKEKAPAMPPGGGMGGMGGMDY